MMAEAIAAAASVRTTSPNPWVGCVIVPDGEVPASIGATEPPGGPHAEAAALALAGATARGATVYVTLEPCSHTGRTPPCADALIAAGVRRVVVGIVDPDPRVAGHGHRAAPRRRDRRHRRRGRRARSRAQLAPYSKHRPTGRPWVVLKLAATPRRAHRGARRHQPVDHRARWPGPTATACGPRATPSWSGAGTVRADDPGPDRRATPTGRDPLRVVLGTGPRGRPGPPRPRDVGRPRRDARRSGPRGRAAAPGRGRGDRRRRLPRGRPRRSLRPLPGAGPVRRRRRPAAVRRARARDHRRRVAGPHRLGRVRSAGPAGRAGRAGYGRGAAVFTGIVEELGGCAAARRRPLRASTRRVVLDDSRVGDSIAVNGCCLTVVDVGAGWWAADVVDETLARTNLGELCPGDAGQPRAAGAAGRPPRRPPGPGSRRRRRRDRRRRHPTCASGRRPSCCATSSRRARSPSTAAA